MIPVTEKLIAWMQKNDASCPRVSTLADEKTLELTYARRVAELMASGELDGETYKNLTKGGNTMNSPDPEQVFGRGNDDGGRYRVKDPSEAYSEKRWSAKHAKTGQPVFDPIYKRECSSIDEASHARYGCMFKHLANRAGVTNNPLSEHERTLLDEMCEKEAWCGKIGPEFFDYIGPDRQLKALIDDSTSGGLEVVPILFDADLISFPLLNGELFPLVDLKEVPRGRRIEGASISTPTMSWGGGDNAEISLFTTTSMVSALDTTIFCIDGAVEIGRDFLSDSPVNVGETLTRLVGERLTAELDKVIANGNGTTRPTGLFQAAGVSTVATDNGAGGPPTVNDYLSLLFALAKQYRSPTNRVVFVSNDTTYQRSRQIAIDTASPTTDQRPALSPLVDVHKYTTLELPHKINNDLANTALGIAAMSRYRMYRRLGLEVRFEQGGQELARKNLTLLVFRARFGGRLMDSSAFVKLSGVQT